MSLTINNINISVNRMFKFATAQNKAEATEVGPIDTFMDFCRSIVGNQTKKEQLEIAYDEFRDNIRTIYKDKNIYAAKGDSIAAFKTLAELSDDPKRFKIIKTNRTERVNGTSGNVVYEFCADSHILNVIAAQGTEYFDRELAEHFRQDKSVCYPKIKRLKVPKQAIKMFDPTQTDTQFVNETNLKKVPTQVINMFDPTQSDTLFVNETNLKNFITSKDFLFQIRTKSDYKELKAFLNKLECFHLTDDTQRLKIQKINRNLGIYLRSSNFKQILSPGFKKPHDNMYDICAMYHIYK